MIKVGDLVRTRRAVVAGKLTGIKGSELPQWIGVVVKVKQLLPPPGPPMIRVLWSHLDRSVLAKPTQIEKVEG